MVYVSRENRGQQGKEGAEKNLYDLKRAGEGKGEQGNVGEPIRKRSLRTGPCGLSHPLVHFPKSRLL